MFASLALRLLSGKIAAAALFVLSVATSMDAQVDFKKGDRVVVTVPSTLADVAMGGLWMDVMQFNFELRAADGAVEVFDPTTKEWRRDWRLAGFPSSTPLTVKNVKKVKRRDRDGREFTELTLNVRKGFDYRLWVPVDQPDVFGVVVASAAAADSVVRASYDALAAHFFTGPLSDFTPDERQLLLRFAHVTANGTKIGSETYKGVTYLTTTLPGDGSTWNDLVVNQSKRLGKLIGEQLTLLKLFAEVSVPHTKIGGLKLVQPSRHGTAPDYTNVKTDMVEAYFPLAALLEFAAADITSQQLVNRSIILVNTNRVEIDLSSQ